MSTQHDQLDAQIAAWVADQLDTSPEWSTERYARVRSYLDTSEEQLREAA
ncbi:hypothetical protein [Streptomyces hundungensis]